MRKPSWLQGTESDQLGQRRDAKVSLPHKSVVNTDIVESSDLYADVASRWDWQSYYGYDRWFAGHRNGASGLANPNTAGINSK